MGKCKRGPKANDALQDCEVKPRAFVVHKHLFTNGPVKVSQMFSPSLFFKLKINHEKCYHTSHYHCEEFNKPRASPDELSYAF